MESHRENRGKKLLVKFQRRELSRFFIFSAVYYIFLIILSFSVIPLAVANIRGSDDEKYGSAVVIAVFTLFGSVSLGYALRRIMWLLEEKDEEMRFRSLKVGEEVLQDFENEGDETSNYSRESIVGLYPDTAIND